VQVKAQTDRNYVLAIQWVRMQEYDKAKEILEDLVKNEPSNQAYLKQLVECYIQTKDYKNGIDILLNPASKVSNLPQFDNDLANLYHLLGDTEKAFQIWDKIIKENSRNMMMYQVVANTLMERREFKKAAVVYKEARLQLKNGFLYLNELASAYLQASEYGEAAKELLAILENNPTRSDLVQRQFARYDDEFLFDEAIILLEEANLEQRSVNETLAQSKREFLLWLYMERGLEKKALRWAQMLERKYPADYFVYNVGQNLVRRESFYLAEEAFDFYLNGSISQLKPIAAEAKAYMFIKWAKSLQDNGLSILGKADSLNKVASDLLEMIVETEKDFDNRTQVILKLIDLNLEQLSNQNRARELYNLLIRDTTVNLKEDQTAFLLGRFAMLDADFRKARIELTRANRNSKNADMLEKSRYYLALNDFFAGDFDFSKIQLKAVERQNSSFYANDAIKLRNWIRKGIQKDSVTPELVTFSKAMLAISRHEFKAGLTILTTEYEGLGQLQLDGADIIANLYRKEDPLEAYVWLGAHPQIRQNEQLFFSRIALGYALNSVSAIDALKIANKSAKDASNVALVVNGKVVDGVQLQAEMQEYLKAFPSSFYAEKVRGFLRDLMEVES